MRATRKGDCNNGRVGRAKFSHVQGALSGWKERTRRKGEDVPSSKNNNVFTLTESRILSSLAFGRAKQAQRFVSDLRNCCAVALSFQGQFLKKYSSSSAQTWSALG